MTTTTKTPADPPPPLLRNSPFPPEWGRPPGTTYSEERARWIADNIATTAGTDYHAQLAQRDLKLVQDLRAIELERLHRIAP